MISKDINKEESSTAFSKKHKSDKNGEKVLIKFLELKLNNLSSEKRIRNINLEDKVYFFKNSKSLDIVPLRVSGEYLSKGKILGKIKLQLELKFRFDKPSGVFMSQTVFNKFMGVFQFSRITLINHNIKKEVEIKKKILPVKIDKPLTSSKFNFNYDNNIKDNGLDTINSLIPEEIKITTEYEKSSENNITSQKVRL